MIHNSRKVNQSNSFVVTPACIMSKNGQTYFKSLAVFMSQDFESVIGHFSALCMKGLYRNLMLRINAKVAGKIRFD